MLVIKRTYGFASPFYSLKIELQYIYMNGNFWKAYFENVYQISYRRLQSKLRNKKNIHDYSIYNQH